MMQANVQMDAFLLQTAVKVPSNGCEWIYTTIQKFAVSKIFLKWISKDALNLSKVTVESFDKV